jgi:GxxExxY protein
MTQQAGNAPFDDGSDAIIGACIEVHRHLGPGLLESVYEACLCQELHQRGMSFRRQVPVPFTYKGLQIECGYRLDLLVEGQIVVELKVVDRLLPIHEAQALTYLRMAGLKTALLVNFNVPVLKVGLRRIVNKTLLGSG